MAVVIARPDLKAAGVFCPFYFCDLHHATDPASSAGTGAGGGWWEVTKSFDRMRVREQVAPTRARNALTMKRTSRVLAKLEWMAAASGSRSAWGVVSNS
jgi:hypothetical protein